MRDTASPAAGTLSKKARSVSLGAGCGQQAQGRLGDDPERALGADEEVRQVVAHDVLGVPAAGADDLAVGEHDLEAQDVVARDAVLHAAQAAGVLGEVAADRAGLEATPGRAGRRGPCAATASPRAALMTPGWVTTSRSSGSISRMRSMRGHDDR